MTKANKDQLFAAPSPNIADFVFDQAVVDVFPDMINRSVPGYGSIINTIGLLARQYLQPNSRAYDLGCSLGASSLAMAQGATHQGKAHDRKEIQSTAIEGIQIIGVDNSEAMVIRGNELIHQSPYAQLITLQQGDLCEQPIENASMVVLNFTLQFISLPKRLPVLKKIYAGMRPGAALVLSEKICFNDEFSQQTNEMLHHQFKQSNGYSTLEISQKRSALENVLEPETLTAHFQRLQEAGFQHCNTWFQCFNFASMIAIK